MENQLRRWGEERGYAVAWGPAKDLLQAWQEVRERRTAGELERGFYESELSAIVDSERPPVDGTVVVVAKPRPASRVGFELEDGLFETILPPTYARYRATFEDVRQDLAAHGLPGVQLELLTGPLKALASRLGLVRFGRNNVTYVPGAGSYLQLCGYLTEARLKPSTPVCAPPQLLEECRDCSACRRACPTQAIDPARVLLHAERCLTFVNENPGEWPSWVPASAHRCLIGCLTCQRACPANPKLHVEDTGLCFSATETRLLLGSGQPAELRGETGIRTKLAWLGQPYAEPVLGRNLRALLQARRARRQCGPDTP
jgi:epoxyqueuosine reductase